MYDTAFSDLSQTELPTTQYARRVMYLMMVIPY